MSKIKLSIFTLEISLMVMFEDNYISLTEVEKLVLNIKDKVESINYKPDYIGGISNRGIVPAMILSKMMNIPMITLDIRRVSHKKKRTEIRKWASYPFDVKGKSILIIDDFLYSGYTMKMAKIGLASLGAIDIKTSVLFRIKTMQIKEYIPDMYANDKYKYPPIIKIVDLDNS